MSGKRRRTVGLDGLRWGVGLAAMGMGIAACAGGPIADRPPPSPTDGRIFAEAPRLALGDDWYQDRARALGISEATARARDAEFGATAPPEPDFWDDHMRRSTALVWQQVCNECHGGKRTIEGTVRIPPPPEGWPAQQARFFRRTRAHRSVFRTISNGIPASDELDPPRMPSFRSELAREQIWGMIYFIEAVSRRL